MCKAYVNTAKEKSEMDEVKDLLQKLKDRIDKLGNKK